MSNDTSIKLSIQDNIATLILNRPLVRNAFDDKMVRILTEHLETLQEDNTTRIVVLRGEGNDFSAGANVNWMRQMIQFTKEENYKDALALSKLMYTLNHFPKPTIALVQGATFGGGVGLVACCDIALATEDAFFCLSEVKLGLIPAIISPYLIQTIGERATRRYMLTAEVFNVKEALKLQLIHEIIKPTDLDTRLQFFTEHLLQSGPYALTEAKKLIPALKEKTFSDLTQIEYTAHLIAKLRVSKEAQEGLSAFLEKRPPRWSK